MTLKRYCLVSRTLSIVLAFSIAIAFITPVYATDSVDSLEESTSNLQNELNSLNQELTQLSNEISAISSQISDMTSRIREVQEELAIAKGEEIAQYDAMKQRMKYMYENGNTSLLEILFASSSMADFLHRAEYMSMINEYDRNALEKLEETQKEIAEKESQLTQEQETLVALQESLASKKASVNERISETSSELSAKSEALEAARKAEEEARKAAEALAQQIQAVKPTTSNTSSSSSSLNSFNDYTATASDIELFAALIECEAGSSNYEGMLAVASVVVNRMNNRYYPDTLRGVIFQSGQFPPAHNGKVNSVLARGVKDSCLQAANDALAGKNNVGDCLSFRSASSGHEGTVIGDNVFF